MLTTLSGRSSFSETRNELLPVRGLSLAKMLGQVRRRQISLRPTHHGLSKMFGPTVGNDASLRGTGDQTSLHPCLRDICAALLYHIHSLETPPELE